jgi:hypothetical protein
LSIILTHLLSLPPMITNKWANMSLLSTLVIMCQPNGLGESQYSLPVKSQPTSACFFQGNRLVL